jgi:hypothetical protein
MEEEAFRKETEDEIGPFRMVRKKDAARRQILMACSCLHEGEWECAITLAGAAEGQIEDAKGPTMFSMIKNAKSKSKFESEREHVAFVNGVRDWLKHSSDQKDKLICEREAIFMVGRALSKYWNVYRDNLEDIKVFAEWSNAKGFGSGFPSYN